MVAVAAFSAGTCSRHPRRRGRERERDAVEIPDELQGPDGCRYRLRQLASGGRTRELRWTRDGQAASLVGGFAPTREILIGARAFQGLAGAFMAAASLAIITASFEPGPKLHRAIGLWAAMNGLGAAAGVLLGGLLTEVSWRWVLLINPPIGLIAAGVALAVVADRRRRREGNFDLAGALLLTVGQMVLVYGIVEAGLAGWSSAIAIGPILGGLALLMLFNVVEVRFASSPLIPFKDITKGLGIANLIVLLFSASLFPMWFVSSSTCSRCWG